MGGYAERLLPGSSPFALFGSIFVLVVLWFIAGREATPLRKVPGPFLASITKLWVVQKQRGYKRPLVDMELHKKYGPIVRVAPNEVIVSSPQAFRTIYKAGSSFRKGEWYIGTGSCGWAGEDALNLLSEYNMEKYRAQRRAIGPAYSETTMKNMESQLDAILEKNIGIMRERSGQPVDIDMFFNMFGSDCYATMTFGNCMDLVGKNEVHGSIHAIHHVWKYMHVAGYFPLLHRAFTAITHMSTKQSYSLIHMINLIRPFLETLKGKSRKAQHEAVNPFAFPMTQLKSRFDDRANSSIEPKVQTYPNDITGKLFQLQAEKGALKDSWIRGIAMTNFGAGVETTAIVISTLIIQFVSHPGCQHKIHAELDLAKKEGKIGQIAKMRDMQEHLPFLNACLMESMRLHPVVGMPLVRKVPEGGVELEGKWLPGGTSVGINSWVLSRNKSLYGDDAEEWRPERWLEYSPEKLKYLETYSVSFGTGARSCPGKYLAQTVYRKMIPMLFQNFEWSFVDPNAEKVLQCTFSVRYINMMMKWKVREQATV